MPEEHEGDEINRYEYSGIEERHGHIPIWLGVVYLAMGIFMVYYLVHFWTNKG